MILICSIAFLAVLTFAYSGSTMYDVVELQPTSDEQQQLLHTLLQKHDVDVLHRATVVVPSNSAVHFERDLQEHDIAHNIVKRNAQSSLFTISDSEEGQFRRGQSLTSYDPNKYYRYEHMVNFLRAATDRRYSEMAELFKVGETQNGREILGIKISQPSINNAATPKKIVWLDAGLHAREWAAPATALYFIWSLLTRTHDRKVRLLLQEADFYIVPNMNPDGYEYSWRPENRYWRKNRAGLFCGWSDVSFGGSGDCCGVDLNRNFPFKWGVSGASHNPCQDIYLGNRPSSEAETRAYMSTVARMKHNITLFVTLHTFGQTVLVPYGYATDAYPDNYSEMFRVAEIGVQAMERLYGANYTAMHSAKLYPAGGGSDDWAKSLGIPYVYLIELRPNPSRVRVEHFHLRASDITKSGRELLAGVAAMLHTIRN